MKNGKHAVQELRQALGAIGIILAALGAASASAARAAEADPQGPRGLWLFGGLGFGAVDVNANLANERDQSGSVLRLEALGSTYGEKWVFDFGLGWSRASTETSNRLTEVNARSGFLLLAPKYRFGQRFQLGPVANYYFGADYSFAPSYNEDRQPLFLGIQAAFDVIQKPRFILRLVGQGMKDVTIPNRGVTMGMIGVQFGLPLGKSADASSSDASAPGVPPGAEPDPSLPKETGPGALLDSGTNVSGEVSAAPTAPVSDTSAAGPDAVDVLNGTTAAGAGGDTLSHSHSHSGEAYPAAIPNSDKSVIALDEEAVHFDTDQARLAPESRRFLAALAAFLVERQDLWERLTVEGHTDRRGKRSYNLKLSRARAKSIRDSLIRYGVPRSRIASTGYGPDRPADPRNSEFAWAHNRRVELRFQGLADPGAVRDKIEQLKREIIGGRKEI